jgi:hypothetical protein
VIIVIAFPPLVVFSRYGSPAVGRTAFHVVNLVAVYGGSQLLERDLFDLTNTLGAHAEDAGKLAQRARRTLEPEALGHDPLLALVELCEERCELERLDLAGHPIVRVLGRRIGHEL